jgi:hypothetical protein
MLSFFFQFINTRGISVLSRDPGRAIPIISLALVLPHEELKLRLEVQ